MNIYYLGPEGSFSEIVVKKVYANEDSFVAVSSFTEIVEKVQKDSESIGALVIENSISSSVHANIDLMYENEVLIVGEAFMKMQMDVLGIKGTSVSEITDIYSHPQAISQCTKFIKEHKLVIHESKSTSEAAEYVKKSNDKSKAAIGSSLLAERCGLDILAKDIANIKHNLSRWIFISQISKIPNNEVDKVTYIFKVKHEPGSLVKVLSKIAEAKGNLTKIESRPLAGTNWEYGFWIDVEIPVGSKSTFDEIMKREAFYCRVVGSYKKGILL